MSDAQSRRDENAKRIEELQNTDNRTAQQDIELRNLEAQNNLLEAQVKIREEAQKQAANTAAEDASAALTNKNGHWWQILANASSSAMAANGMGDGYQIETKDIVSETADLISERKELEKTIQKASVDILSLDSGSKEFKEKEDIITNAQNRVDRLSKEIIDNKSTILSLYENLIGIDGNAIDGVSQSLIDSIENIFPELNPEKYVKNAFNGIENSGGDPFSYLSWYNTLNDAEKKIVFDIIMNADGAIPPLEDLKNQLSTISEIADAINNANTLDNYKIAVDGAIEKQNKLTSAINSSNSATGLTTEEVQDLVNTFGNLEDFNMSSLFERTANGIRINANALKYYNNEIINKEREELTNKITEKEKELNKLRSENEKENADRIKSLSKEISEMKLYLNEYDGAISKYKTFIDSSQTANSRDSFANVAAGYKNVQELINQGWVSDSTVTSYLDLMLGSNWQGKFDNAQKAFAQLRVQIDGTNHSLKDYFTYDSSGNLTSQGAWNFVKDLVNLTGKGKLKDGIATKKDDGSYELDLTGGNIDTVAQALKTTTDMVELLGKALADAGMDVKFDTIDDKIKNTQEHIGELKDRLDNLNPLDDALEISETEREIARLQNKEIELKIKKATSDGTTMEDLAGMSDIELKAKLGIDDSQLGEYRDKINAAINSGDIKVDISNNSLDALKTSLTNLEGTAKYTGDFTGISSEDVPILYGTVQYSGSFTNPSAGPRAAGTFGSIAISHADGTAYNVLNYKRLTPSYAGGKVGLPNDEYALTNEVG